MNEHRYDTYGWRAADIDDVARHVATLLQIELEPRHSLYRGDYYGWRTRSGVSILLQKNFVEADDGLPTADEFPDHVVLLYASDIPSHWFDRILHIPGAERLESNTLP